MNNFELINILNFTEDNAVCNVLNLAGYNILLDCGVNNTSIDKSQYVKSINKVQQNLIDKLDKNKESINYIFISDSSIKSIGLLPFITKKYPNAEIYASTPINKIGYFNILDFYTSIIKTFKDESLNETFNYFNEEDIYNFFNSFEEVNYYSNITIINNLMTFVPIPSGYSLGGIAWKITYMLKNILYWPFISIENKLNCKSFNFEYFKKENIFLFLSDKTNLDCFSNNYNTNNDYNMQDKNNCNNQLLFDNNNINNDYITLEEKLINHSCLNKHMFLNLFKSKYSYHIFFPTETISESFELISIIKELISKSFNLIKKVPEEILYSDYNNNINNNNLNELNSSTNNSFYIYIIAFGNYSTEIYESMKSLINWIPYKKNHSLILNDNIYLTDNNNNRYSINNKENINEKDDNKSIKYNIENCKNIIAYFKTFCNYNELLKYLKSEYFKLKKDNIDNNNNNINNNNDEDLNSNNNKIEYTKDIEYTNKSNLHNQDISLSTILNTFYENKIQINFVPITNYLIDISDWLPLYEEIITNKCVKLIITSTTIDNYNETNKISKNSSFINYLKSYLKKVKINNYKDTDFSLNVYESFTTNTDKTNTINEANLINNNTEAIDKPQSSNKNSINDDISEQNELNNKILLSSYDEYNNRYVVDTNNIKKVKNEINKKGYKFKKFLRFESSIVNPIIENEITIKNNKNENEEIELNNIDDTEDYIDKFKISNYGIILSNKEIQIMKDSQQLNELEYNKSNFLEYGTNNFNFNYNNNNDIFNFLKKKDKTIFANDENTIYKLKIKVFKSLNVEAEDESLIKQYINSKYTFIDIGINKLDVSSYFNILKSLNFSYIMLCGFDQDCFSNLSNIKENTFNYKLINENHSILNNVYYSKELNNDDKSKFNINFKINSLLRYMSELKESSLIQMCSNNTIDLNQFYYACMPVYLNEYTNISYVESSYNKLNNKRVVNNYTKEQYNINNSNKVNYLQLKRDYTLKIISREDIINISNHKLFENSNNKIIKLNNSNIDDYNYLIFNKNSCNNISKELFKNLANLNNNFTLNNQTNLDQNISIYENNYLDLNIIDKDKLIIGNDAVIDVDNNNKQITLKSKFGINYFKIRRNLLNIQQ